MMEIRIRTYQLNFVHENEVRVLGLQLGRVRGVLITLEIDAVNDSDD